jgi:hypothetical protein
VTVEAVSAARVQGVQELKGDTGDTGVTQITTRTSSISFTVDGATGEIKNGNSELTSASALVPLAYATRRQRPAAAGKS